MSASTALLDLLVSGIDRVLPEASEVRRTLHRKPFVSGEEGPTRDAMTRKVRAAAERHILRSSPEIRSRTPLTLS